MSTIEQQGEKKCFDRGAWLTLAVAFPATAREATDLDTLSATLVRVVEETMQPEKVSLWLRPGKGKTS